MEQEVFVKGCYLYAAAPYIQQITYVSLRQSLCGIVLDQSAHISKDLLGSQTLNPTPNPKSLPCFLLGQYLLHQPPPSTFTLRADCPST